MKKSVLLFVTTCIVVSCSDERDGTPRADAELLIGRWNSYEYGTTESGFNPMIVNFLTIAYESGIHFKDDGTFRPRLYNAGVWTEEEEGSLGTYVLKDKTITLTFNPGTQDESVLDMELVKITEKHLWFKHSLFLETEFHLERADE